MINWKPRKVGGLINWAPRQAVAAPPPPPPPPPPATTRTISFPLLLRSGAPAANLTGIHGAWFDQSMPHQLLAPMDRWVNGTTDASGVFTRVVLSNLAPGGEGSVDLSDSDGNPATFHKSYFGKVTVS